MPQLLPDVQSQQSLALLIREQLQAATVWFSCNMSTVTTATQHNAGLDRSLIVMARTDQALHAPVC